MVNVKIKKLFADATLPEYATDGSACFDLFAYSMDGMLAMSASCDNAEPVLCGTGLAFEIPEGHVMLIFSRSGHGFKHGIRLANCVGVIDSDYRGEVMVKLTKDYILGDEDRDIPLIKAGDRIAQAMVIPYPRVRFVQANELSDTKRGAAGFGSTGR